MWKCPECQEEVEDLNYNVGIASSEWGTAQLVTTPVRHPTGAIDVRSTVDRHDSDDQGNSDWSGDPDYTCPHCDAEVDPRNLIWEGDDTPPVKTAEPIKMTEEEPEIMQPSLEIKRINPLNHSNNIIICQEIMCKHPFVFDVDGLNPWNMSPEGKNRFASCPNCGFMNDLKKYFDDISSGKILKRRRIRKRINRILVH